MRRMFDYTVACLALTGLVVFLAWAILLSHDGTKEQPKGQE